MPSNIEIKAHARDWPRLLRSAAELSDTPVQVIKQEDTFFHVPTGRLKLRIFSPAAGELIFYQRPDHVGPKQSQYVIAPTAAPATLKETLAAALGVRGVVRKCRLLYLAGQTRIHLDEVENLGRFVELEVVMEPGQSPAEGQRIATELMARLGIAKEDLIVRAYVDMLE